MEERRQNGGRRRQIVQEFEKNISDNTRRLVCFLYMNGYKDGANGAIRRILKIDRQRLQQIKTQLAFDLIKAGIRNSEG